MKTIAIYHKNCTDGTTAASVVLKKFPSALLFPMSHSHAPEEISEVVKTASIGDKIFTVDCSMGAIEFLNAGHKVTVIDHHVSVKAEMDEIAAKNSALTYVFDNKKSGSSLAWSYFFPEEKMPEIIKYVEDFDLWNWKYGDDTKAIVNYLWALMNNPIDTLKLFDAPLDEIKKNGQAVTNYINLQIDKSIKHCEPINLKVGSHLVPFYNITEHKSEAGNLLAIEKDQTVALFSIDGGEVKISFRSLDKHSPSALDLATILGGGGHRNASGGGMKLKDFIDSIAHH